MKTIKILSLLLACALITACNEENSEYFSIKSNDRIIPIEVKSELNSDVLIVRFYNDYSSGYNPTEIFACCIDKYSYINYKYYHSNSVGAPCINIKCGLKDLSADLDLWVSILDQKYGNSKNIFLYGNGFAASIILFYASTGKYRDKVDGLIINGATHNVRNTIRASKEKLKELLQNEIDITDNDKLERRLEEFLKELDQIDANTISVLEYYVFLYDQFGTPQTSDRTNNFLDDGKTNNFLDDMKTIDLDCWYPQFTNFYRFNRLDEIDEDLTNIVKNIATPVLMLWMEDEFLNPLSVGQELYDLLETPEKELHTFEYICTAIFIGESDNDRSEDYRSYSTAIENFIKKYK